jgi:signal transduction histidine kinase
MRASVFATLLVVVVALGGGWFFASRLLSPSDAVAQDVEATSDFYSIVLTQPLDPASPLHTGDTLVAIDGRSLASWEKLTVNPTVPHPQWRNGQQLVYTVERGAQTQHITVTLAPFRLATFLAAAGPYLLTVLLAEVIAIYVFVRRFTDAAARLVFLAFSMRFLYQVCCTLSLSPLNYTSGNNLRLFALWAGLAYPLSSCLLAHLTLTFPRCLPVIQRRPWVPQLLYIAPITAFVAVNAALVAPVGLDEVFGTIFGVANVVAYVGGFLIIVIGGIAQYRVHRDTSARQQWRLVTLPVVLTLVASNVRPWVGPLLGIPGLFAVNPQLGNGGHGDVLTLVSLLIPLGLTVAILRYRLWDFDVIVNRSLVYGLLSLLLLGVYSALVLGLGALAQTLTSTVRALVATGVVAILFQPLRLWLQRGINHLFYGWRDEPYRALAQLGHRLASTLAPSAVLPVIAETVGQTLRVPYVAITVAPADAATGRTPAPAAVYGSQTANVLRLPLSYQQSTVGELWLAPRAPDETFTAADIQLLADLARQIGIAVHAVQLTYDLQKSRERLVLAREEERRRLRRDLHDGLGPTLAALALKADTVGDLVPTEPEQAQALARELDGDIRATIGEIRRLVYALRPPTLDELGLLAALHECAEQYRDVTGAPAITLTLPSSLPPLPAAVEVAVLRITQEAMTNAVRHSAARTCAIQIGCTADALTLTITDDGIGLPQQVHAGVGLRSMRERAEELGGTCAIACGPAGGARVDVLLPLAPLIAPAVSPISSREVL